MTLPQIKIRKQSNKGSFEPKMKTLTDKLWEITRQIVFVRHGTDCYTCPQINLIGRNLQCGHGYPKGALGVSMQYDLRILRPQCARCNIFLGGMGTVFWKHLEQEIGKEAADALFHECRASKGNPIKARPYVMGLIEEYQKIII